MSKSITLKASLSGLAVLGLAACATTSAPSEAPTVLAAAPDAAEINRISTASPLVQADFWNTQYNNNPADLDVSLSFIDALMKIKSHERAIEVAYLASAAHPDNPDVWHALGRAATRSGDMNEAITAYTRQAELQPYNATPVAAIGAIFDRKGEHDIAQVAYEKALLIDPDRPATLSNYGLSLALTGRLEEAETKLASAMALPGATPTVRQNYALVLGLLGKFDQAREVAAVGAPAGVAERNADFLARMIGDNPALADLAETRPAPAPIVEVEVPAAAPTQAIVSAGLQDTAPTPQNSGPQTPAPQTLAPKTTTASLDADTAPTNAPRSLRLRSRDRGGD